MFPKLPDRAGAPAPFVFFSAVLKKKPVLHWAKLIVFNLIIYGLSYIMSSDMQRCHFKLLCFWREGNIDGRNKGSEK